MHLRTSGGVCSSQLRLFAQQSNASCGDASFIKRYIASLGARSNWVSDRARRLGIRGGPVGGGYPPLTASIVATASTLPTYATAGFSSGSPRVCILGGGFGGLYTAIKLNNLLWKEGTKPQVTLIDQSDRFVFKPLLYELINGTASATEVAPPFTQLLAPYAVKFIQGKATEVQQFGGGEERVDAGGVVMLSDGGSVEYDWLVVALGSSVNTFGIEGVKELAMPFVSYEDAKKLLSRLQYVESSVEFPEVAVVGGGYSGVEISAVIAERLEGRGRVKIITNADILTRAPAGQREAAKKVLQDRGVSIVTDAKVVSVQREVGEIPEDRERDLSKRLVTLDMTAGPDAGLKQVIEADIVLWTAGLSPASKSPSVKLPFPVNGRGLTETDATLRVLNCPHVFALGDIAVCSPSPSGSGSASQTFPATAQVAFQQADYVAWNVWCAINGRPLLPFRYQHLGDMMSLGRLSGAVALPLEVPDEISRTIRGTPVERILQVAGVSVSGATGGITLEGPLAQVLRRAAYLYRQPTLEQQVRVGTEWLEDAAQLGIGLARRVLDPNRR